MVENERRQRGTSRWQPGKVAWLVAILCLVVATTGWGMEFGNADLSLRSTTRYLVQWSDDPTDGLAADDNHDQDLNQLLAADLNWAESGITVSVMGRYVKDLDGTSNGSIFQDYTDSRGDHRQDFEIYYAYMEKKDFLAPGLNVRLGRQYAYSAETVHYDGLQLHYELPDWYGLEAEVFGGRLVQHYSDITQDSVGGYNLSLHPLSSLSFYLDGVFSEETSTEGSVFWQPMENIQTRGRLAFINDHTRFFDVSTQAVCPVTGTVLDASLYRRYKIAADSDFIFDYTYSLDEALSNELTSLYLLKEQGYLEYEFRISQPIPGPEGLTVYARYTKRELAHDNDEDLYNTDFDRYTIGCTIDEWLNFKGFHLDVGYSYWEEDRDTFYEGESTSYFADWRQELLEHFELGAGFYHKTEDINSLIENEASTRYEAFLKYGFMDHAWVKLLYQYDEDDFYEDELGVDHINALTLSLHLEY